MIWIFLFGVAAISLHSFSCCDFNLSDISLCLFFRTKLRFSLIEEFEASVFWTLKNLNKFINWAEGKRETRVLVLKSETHLVTLAPPAVGPLAFILMFVWSWLRVCVHVSESFLRRLFVLVVMSNHGGGIRTLQTRYSTNTRVRASSQQVDVKPTPETAASCSNIIKKKETATSTG